MRPVIFLALAYWLGRPQAVALATVLPAGFVETEIAAGFLSPTATVHAADGRIFVAEQGGTVRVVKEGAVLPTPFAALAADSIGERGLLGITLDPAFPAIPYVYVYYSATAIGANRLSRLTADGDVALPGEVVLAELPPYLGSDYHMGGALLFGPDGRLYLGVGDHADGNNSQSLSTVFGKILRFEPDGSIPADNPFVVATTGLNRAIWALGLRNPFTAAFHSGSGRLFVNDVGSAAGNQEEINDGMAAANYGWPLYEGAAPPPYVSPVYAYPRQDGCAIAGGTFYSPPVPGFPAAYVDGYFFADFCGRWIRWLDPGTDTPSDFASGLAGNPVDLDVGLDGALYYLTRVGDYPRDDDLGFIVRISSTLPPSIPAASARGCMLLAMLLGAALLLVSAVRRRETR